MAKRIPEDAFAQYVGMGAERSYQALADRLDVTKRAIVKIATREDWSARLQKIEHEARESSDKKLAEGLEEMRTRHLKTLRAMHARAVEAIRQYPLNSGMEAMKAAELVIKMERLITGEATERGEVAVSEVVRRESERWLTRKEEAADEPVLDACD